MRVREAHTIPKRPAFRLDVGDRVQVGERDTEWPEFVFVTATHGSGWVPARHLSHPLAAAGVEVPYDITELATAPGEVLDVVMADDLSGWLWCRSSRGGEGWVPARIDAIPGDG
ncbi:MAG: hypothetical protein JF887_05420 [Candidatus Dormibacteraeota bacterium]|uniref:SH3 domain-containing protein n=1 Tax=Candidatus Amunia macphersoniae TaxID=3127014 RepID=A0A934KLV9_9BACT|nr:hypothetical protein [Candidatus Dormibacteraeota bacterium]